MTTENWTDLPTLQYVANAQANGWEIEVKYEFYDWGDWDGNEWRHGWQFRGRPRQPKMKEVKSCCWRYKDGGLVWRDERYALPLPWIRQPHLDMTTKVPE